MRHNGIERSKMNSKDRLAKAPSAIERFPSSDELPQEAMEWYHRRHRSRVH